MCNPTNEASAVSYAAIEDFDVFLDRLSKVDWEHDDARFDCESILRSVNRNAGLIADKFLAVESEMQTVKYQCHETSTHYKWFLAADRSDRYRVWLHDYKPSVLRRSGHANTAHNHRYSFASLVLHGGFKEVRYPCAGRRPILAGTPSVAHIGAGDTFVVQADEIHQMAEIEDGTLTLLVEGPTLRNFSEVYDLSTGTVTAFHDFPGRYPTTRDKVIAATTQCGQPSASH